MKLIQKKVAISKFTLPMAVAYGLLVWAGCGLLGRLWAIQLGCFLLSVYLMVELNNSHALLRIYSRMVSTSFIMLACCACYLFPSLQGAIVQVSFIAMLLLLFRSYQDPTAAGWTYYSFLCLGVGSLTFVQALWLVPVLWLLMYFTLLSLSLRTWMASLLGLLTPYWAWACLLTHRANFQPLVSHVLPLADFQLPVYDDLSDLIDVGTYGFVVLLALLGIGHYLRTLNLDKIRVRMLYGTLIWLFITVATLTVVMPQHYDCWMRLTIVCTSPLIAHFLALTETKLTNIIFIVVTTAAVTLTLYNLWTSSLLFSSAMAIGA